MNLPPPLPQTPRPSISRTTRFIIGLALLPALILGLLIILRFAGLLRLFYMPTGGMTPAVSKGDHVLMERLTYLSRQPRRGDIVVFKTDGMTDSLPPKQFYVMRVAGEPGDRLQLSKGKLFINNKQVSLSNNAGEITYDLPPHTGALSLRTDMTVPASSFFVLGDNSANSFDSRFWGAVPRSNIVGRVAFCYWPSGRMGRVK